MKPLLLFASAAISALLGMAASAETLYAVSMRTYSDPSYKGVEGNLYVVATDTAVTRLVASLTVGGKTPVGLDGLAIHPKTGVFYGITAPTSGAIPRSLVTIDPQTGIVTLVGSLGHTGSDIEFDPDGTLYMWLPTSYQLATVDLETGAATPRGRPFPQGALKGGIALIGGGRALVAATGGKGTLDSIDMATGEVTAGPHLVGAPFPELINGLTYSPKGIIYGINTNGALPPLANLVSIDAKTGKVTSIGDEVENLTDGARLRGGAQSTMMTPMASQKKDLYQILDVPRDANSIDIGLAYRRRTSELQRAVPQDPSAQSLLHEAHEILADPQRRAAYDASLVTAAEKAAASEQAEPDLVLESGEEEEDPRKKFVKPGIAVVVVIIIAIFFAMRSGHAPEAPKPEPVAEAPKPPPPPPPPQPLGSDQILRTALQSVGRVMSYEMSGRAVPLGFAIALEPGVMVTTCHGISGGTQLVVKVGEESNSGSLTVTDEVLDLCRVSVPALNARAVTLVPEDAKAGDKIYLLGANAKGELVLTEGTVTQLRSAGEGKVLEISVPIAPTGSGGAVFDVFGRVIGIATTQHSYGANLNIVIPASAIAQMRSREKPVEKEK
jgi:S1-C subfamily serine protease